MEIDGKNSISDLDSSRRFSVMMRMKIIKKELSIPIFSVFGIINALSGIVEVSCALMDNKEALSCLLASLIQKQVSYSQKYLF